MKHPISSEFRYKVLWAAISSVMGLMLSTTAATFSSTALPTFIFTNSTTLAISDGPPPSAADPFPSAIQVSGLDGLRVKKVMVEIRNLEHSAASDVDCILIAPNGVNIVLMSSVGDNGMRVHSATNISLLFDDDAPAMLQAQTPLQSGSYKPSPMCNRYYYPYPAPADPFPTNGLALSALTGIDPNGQWRLCVVDYFEDDGGRILDGWSLMIEAEYQLSIAPTAGGVRVSWPEEATGRTLETCNCLAPPSWNVVTNQPALSNGKWHVDLPADSPSRFFRLGFTEN